MPPSMPSHTFVHSVHQITNDFEVGLTVLASDHLPLQLFTPAQLVIRSCIPLKDCKQYLKDFPCYYQIGADKCHQFQHFLLKNHIFPLHLFNHSEGQLPFATKLRYVWYKELYLL